MCQVIDSSWAPMPTHNPDLCIDSSTVCRDFSLICRMRMVKLSVSDFLEKICLVLAGTQKKATSACTSLARIPLKKPYNEDRQEKARFRQQHCELLHLLPSVVSVFLSFILKNFMIAAVPY